MPDENGTEATRSDAPSADESLFGDAAGDKAAPVVQEEDPNDAVPDAQDGQGSDDAGEQAAGDATEASENLKVVVSIKGGRATIGVQQPSSDPYIESFDDRGVSELAQEVPLMLERARARWEDAPRHPAHARPASPARRRRSREQGSTQDSTAEEEAAQD